MNNITVTGNLAKDSVLRFLQNGDPVLSFSIGDGAKGKPTIWWNCSLFGKRAEVLSQYLTKGQSITVVGSISKREWTDNDGNKRDALDLRVYELALQGGKQTQPAAQDKASVAKSGGIDDISDDVPF